MLFIQYDKNSSKLQSNWITFRIEQTDEDYRSIITLVLFEIF